MKKIKFALSAIICSFALNSYAQETIPDTSKTINLNEVIISVNKEEETKKNVAQEVMVLTSRQIANSQAMSTADLLSNAGINVQKSQLGGGSPMLRGFEASRIVLMIDGVRLNNLIYRAGHLQDIIKTDNSIFDRVEVLFGPSSTIYGSDALGGVIHMYTKKPMFSDGDKALVKVNVLTRYESANKGLTEHFDLNWGGKKIASLTSFTWSKFNDLMGGRNQNPFYNSNYGERPYYVARFNNKDSLVKNNNRYLQVGSGYSQYDILQKFLYKQNDKITHGINVQYSNSTNVPRYDRLTDPSASTGLESAEWYYGPQSKLLTAYDMNYKKPNGAFENIHVGVNYQSLEESRYNRNFGIKFRNSRIENVNVIGANLDFRKKIKSHDIRFGYDMQLNNLKSTAYKKNIEVDTSGVLASRYPDGVNTMNNFALYFSHTWNATDKVTIVDGFRAGYSMLHSTLVDTAVMFNLPYTNIKQNTPVYSGSIGIINNPSDDLKLSLMLSTGFRVPNVDDMSKIFGSAPGKVIVPNTSIKPEKTINYELGITKIFNKSTRWETSVYYTDFRNIAIVDTYKFNGKDSIMYDGTMSRVYANQNKNAAYIYGFSSNLYSKLNEHFSMSMRFNYTYGRIKTDSTDYPLDHIPPVTARASLMYKNNKFASEFFINYNGWKKIKDYYLNGEDNEQYATALGMPAWLTLNLRFTYQIHKFISLQAGIDNIFDTQYRTFASGINAPGRNVIVALRGMF